MDKNTRRHACAALLLIALFSLVFVFSPVQKAVATIAISSISPNSGYVYDTITVDGTINTTDGSFTVRWNGTAIVATGQAVGVNVHTSFTVPPTAGNRSVTVELIDDAFPGFASPPMDFTLLPRFNLNAAVPTPPSQLQEGSTVPIAVNVTGGEENRVYTANIMVSNPANQNTSILASLSNTTTIGYGDVSKIYPTDFTGAHMNYTGKYVVTSNVTNIAREFTVGLTDRLEYRRNETVQIQAVGYRPSESVMVNITTGGSSVANFPQNITASSAGLLTLSWKVPMNATVGTYTLSVTNATLGGTIKTPADLQDFDILGVRCSVQTVNNADDPVQNALVEVYNATASNGFILRGTTNLTGWIGFNLDSGNYTFKVFFLNVQVGTENQSLTTDTSLIIKLNLVDLVATVKTVTGSPVPFVDIALKLNFTTRDNKTTSQILSMLTNVTGMAKLRNLFTNETYQVEARRYNLLFTTQTLTIEPSPTSALISLELTLPTYTMNVHIIDSKTAPVSGVEIRVYEWASGVTSPLMSLQTNASGDGSFSLPFGVYRFRAYEGDVFLGETLLSLVQNQSNFTFNLSALNVDVTVTVLDYFGRPIANAMVEIERKIAQEYLPIDKKSTGADGSATFPSILGGDSRISVYVAGKLVGAKTQLLDGTSSQVIFNIGEYITIVGYPVETSLFVLFSFMLVLVILLVIISRKRIVQVVRRKPAR